MVIAAHTEQAVLDNLESRWAKQGYRLIRKPPPEELPAFLKGFQPDAIAVGPAPNLVIEIMHSRSPSADTRLRQLQSLFVDQADWRLEVVYVSPSGPSPSPVEINAIRAGLAEARTLAQTAPRSALMLAWACLEAIARNLEPEMASRSLSTGSLTDLLISTGRIPQSDGSLLLSLGQTRNAVAHGQLNLMPSPVHIQQLIELCERLLAGGRAE